MDARTLTRLGSGLLVAAFAATFGAGCAPLRGTRPDLFASTGSGKSADPSNVTPTGGPIPGGTVIAAGGAAQPPAPAPAVPQVQQPPVAPPGPLPAPRPAHEPPVWQPMMTPPVPPVGTHPLRPPVNTDPHVRTTPTASGARLALGPGDVPADRVVELTLHMDALLTQNRELIARIKELETAGVGREQALTEAAREVELVTADAAKTRAMLQAQIALLQEKMKQLEREDIDFLKAVIEALGRLLPPERKP